MCEYVADLNHNWKETQDGMQDPVQVATAMTTWHSTFVLKNARQEIYHRYDIAREQA